MGQNYINKLLDHQRITLAYNFSNEDNVFYLYSILDETCQKALIKEINLKDNHDMLPPRYSDKFIPSLIEMTLAEYSPIPDFNHLFTAYPIIDGEVILDPSCAIKNFPDMQY